ncbi:MAG: TRAP transporter substrate-binding protein [Cyclobacteriaceae bacterium]
MLNLRSVYLVALAALFFGCGQSSDVKVLKLAHGLDVNHPVHKGILNMGDRLVEKSGGKMSIQVYPSGQLGGERECLELLQIGSLAMTKVSAAALENFIPNFEVLGLPYMFSSQQHSFDVLDGPIGDDLLSQGDKFLFRGLCFYDAGARSFYTMERPIDRPEDLEGYKIRVMKSATSVNMVAALGGSPTPISFGELYAALQQGVVDGAENNPPSFYTSRHYEVCKYYSIDEHTMIPDVLLISLEWWNALSDQEQKWVKESAKESVSFQRKAWAESVEESLRIVKEAGVEVSYPDKALFEDKVQDIYASYKDDPEKYELIQRIKAANNEK